MFEQDVDTVSCSFFLLCFVALGQLHGCMGEIDLGQQTFQLQADAQGAVLAAVRQGSFKLIRANPENPRGLPELQLYDLSVDPLEKTDLAQARPDLRAAMLRLLEGGR